MSMPINKQQKSQSFANLIECLEEIRNPSIQLNFKYPLVSILLMALCASLGGTNNWAEVANFCKDNEN